MAGDKDLGLLRQTEKKSMYAGRSSINQEKAFPGSESFRQQAFSFSDNTNGEMQVIQTGYLGNIKPGPIFPGIGENRGYSRMAGHMQSQDILLDILIKS
jgi:hypothetical protein